MTNGRGQGRQKYARNRAWIIIDQLLIYLPVRRRPFSSEAGGAAAWVAHLRDIK
jgi:hypothetical protein